MSIKNFILMACLALLAQSCRKEKPFEAGEDTRINGLATANVSGYVINGIIKNVSGGAGMLFGYEMEFWLAAAAAPNVPVQLQTDLNVAGTVSAGGIVNGFTVTLKAGTTTGNMNYKLAAPVTITGKLTSPASYMGQPVSFTGKFTETLVPSGNAYPSLLFSKDDLPAIRQKVQAGWLASSYAKIKAQADKFLLVKTNPYVQNNAVAGRNMNVHINDLALTGYITNDSRYINKAIDIMCAAAKQWDPAFYDNLNPHLNVADAAHAYAIGYDWLYPYMTPDERTLIKNEIEEFGLWIYNCSLGGSACYGDYGKANLSCNHNAVVHGALGLCALVLGDKPAWKDLAIAHIRGYFTNSLDDDGYNYEGLSYFGYGSLNSIPFSAALLRKGGPDLINESPRNKLVPNYILRQVLPWGSSLVTMNDSDPEIGSAGGLMHLIAKYHDRVGLWTWLRLMGPAGGGGNETYGIGNGTYLGNGSSVPYVIIFADKDLQPQSPAAAGLSPAYFFTSKGANPGGRVSFRSGWGDLDALATFTSGPDRHRGHNHRDENSFTFYSLG
ncbi:MAG: DUF4962 domain-containing protein, partial [Mucilaginibacter sp.]